MRLAVIAYLGFSAGLLTYLGVKYLLEQRQVREAHGEALQEEAARRDAELWARCNAERRKNERFLRDLGLKIATPRVVESVHGVFVRAKSEAEAAEIVAQARAFQPTRAA